MKKYRLLLIALFLLIVIVQLISSWTGNIRLEFWAKPWIMAWITAWFLIFSRKNSFASEVVVAFFFCWLGDILLMLSHFIDFLFYAGVGSFFIGQLNYIRIFIRHAEKEAAGLIRLRPVFLLPYLAYLALILVILLPVVDGFMGAVIFLYGISLTGMSAAALNRRGRVSDRVFWPVFLGSVFFVLSDSLIAFNKFHTDFAGSAFVIMLTYILAQVLIMWGLTLERERES